jgi:protein subunit release factor A
MVTCQQERTQGRNRTLALENLRRKLQALTRRRVPRIPTKVPASVKRKVLAYKKFTADKKRTRRAPKIED